METGLNMDFQQKYKESQAEVANILLENSALKALHQKNLDRLVVLEHEMSQFRQMIFSRNMDLPILTIQTELK